jgi:hypothetical protein
VNELACLSFRRDAQLAVLDGDLQPPGHEGSGEHEPSRALADVDEASGACQTRTEMADVHIAAAIDVCDAQARQIEAATIVEVFGSRHVRGPRVP